MPGDPTHTRIERLDDAERRDELERMLGGEEFLATVGGRWLASSSSPGRRGSTGRTKHLVRRLAPDDIAIIDHRDIDRVSAEELVESGVRVVVNVAESQTGRFPNPGPLLLVRGGVRLIDAPGAELFDEVSDGEPSPSAAPASTATATASRPAATLERDELARALAEQHGRVTRGARGVRREHDAPPARGGPRCSRAASTSRTLRTRFRDRHALVVARGPGHKRDLRIVGRTSATSSRCSSASTAAPTRCSRPATSPT